MARPRPTIARWRIWSLLLGLAVLARADGEDGEEDKEVELGPAMPGEARYWLNLKYISFSEGRLTPHFDPKRNDYELTIHNQDVESFTMTLSLELSKYDLLFLPRIEINGNMTVYTPLNPITHVVYVNEGVGPEDKIVYIKLEDPIGYTHGLFGIPKAPKANEYRIRVLQPPEFDQVVKIDSLEVSGSDGAVLKPKKEDKATGEYWYRLPENEQGANIKAFCNKFSTNVLVNGQSAGQGGTVWTDLSVPHVTWMVECLYANSRWSKNVLSRTYQVHMSHLKDSFVPPVVHLMPQDGKCTQEDTDDIKVPSQIVCRTTTRTIDLIVTFDTTSVEVFIDKGDGHEVNIISGIQTKVQLPTDEVHWALKVEGIHNQEVPLIILVAQQCYEMFCPAGWVPKPALDQGENAVLHLCHGVTCNMEADATTCCREAGASCKDYGLQFQCPAGKEIFDLGFCWGTNCEISDKHFCCLAGAGEGEKKGGKEAQFDIHKGKWQEWWKKQDQRAKTVTKTLGDSVSFATQIKVPQQDEPAKSGSGKRLEEMKEVAEVLKTGLSKHTGTLESHVGVVAKPSKDAVGDDAVTYSVEIKLESGSKKTQAVFKDAKKLVKGDALLKLIQQGLKEKIPSAEATGISAAELQETWKSEVMLRLAPNPSLEFGMKLKVPKAADIDRQGNEEQLQPEVVAALKTAILSLAEVPDKEKMKLNFKRVRVPKKHATPAIAAEKCSQQPTGCREEIMKVLDADRDQLIAQTELQQLQATNPQLAKVDMSKLDADGNGKLNKEELDAALGGGDGHDSEAGKQGAALYAAVANIENEEDDEVLQVVGKIILPHGKEGSKEILEAKLRNPPVVAKRLNKVMRTVVSKDEKEEGSHVVGVPQIDYEVFGVKLGKVSASGIDKMAHFGSSFTAPSGTKSTTPAPTRKPGAVTRRGALKAWLKLKQGAPTQPPMMGMAQITTITRKCLTAPPERKMGLRSSVSECLHLDRRQAWFYSYQTGALQNAFGLCLSADVNGPPPSPGVAQSPQELQQWISYRGPSSTLQWGCDGGWGQKWTYIPSTGMFKLQGGYDEGVCLEQVHEANFLVVALCDGANFHQQFWFEEVNVSKMLMQPAKTAADVPIFAKPYFDGQEPVKSSDSTYDEFRLAKFAKTRAVWYLSQGCSPVPTASCGTPAPDMPGVYVGESVLQLGKKVETLPWQSAMSPSPVEGSGLTMCYYDKSCGAGDMGTAEQLREWTRGCNAGGKPRCRYCGTGSHGPCPKHFNCLDGGLARDAWTQEHKDWCCSKFSIGCPKPYHCLQGLENWRSWEPERKTWCCSYQLLACEDECEKTDEATFRENHHFWCNSFGATESREHKLLTDYQRFEKMLEQMYEEPKGERLNWKDKLPVMVGANLSFVVFALLFLFLTAAAAWLALQRHRTLVNPAPALGADEVEELVA